MLNENLLHLRFFGKNEKGYIFHFITLVEIVNSTP